MQNQRELAMPKREIREQRFEDIKSILNLIENNESTFLSEDNGAGGYSTNMTYQHHEDLEEVAESMNPKGATFMSDIAKIAVLYDKTSPFDRAQTLILENARDEGFHNNLKLMYQTYVNSIKSGSPESSINMSINAFYKNYKVAQMNYDLDPKFVAERIMEIIKIMLSKMKLESRPKSMNKIREKIRDYNPIELSNKKSPGGAAVGTSLALIKNILMARDNYFIKRVIEELMLIMR